MGGAVGGAAAVAAAMGSTLLMAMEAPPRRGMPLRKLVAAAGVARRSVRVDATAVAEEAEGEMMRTPMRTLAAVMSTLTAARVTSAVEAKRCRSVRRASGV